MTKNLFIVFILLTKLAVSSGGPYKFIGLNDTALVSYTAKVIEEIDNDRLGEELNAHLYRYCKLMLAKVDSSKRRVFLFGLTTSINNKGYYLDVEGKFDAAFLLYNKAYQIAKKEHFYGLTGDCLANLGNICMQTDKFMAAKLYYKESVVNLLKANNKVHAAIVLNNLATLTYKNSQHVLSIQYLEKAISLKKSADGANANFVDELIHISKNHHKLNRPELYSYYTDMAFKEAKKSNHPLSIARAYISKGFFFVNTSNLNEASLYIDSSKKLCEEVKSNYLNSELLSLEKAYQKATSIEKQNKPIKKNKQTSALIF